MATRQTVLLLAVTLLGCSDRHTIGQESGKLGQVGNPPRPDGTCNAGLVTCNGVCVDVQSDPANCARCGVACMGSCVGAVCNAPISDMSRRCDPTGAACTAPNNCCDPTMVCNVAGVCGPPTTGADMGPSCAQLGQSCATTACCGAYLCVSGTKVCAESLCPPRLSPCMAGCFDLLGDPANCGACGNVCPPGDTCANGVCGAVQPADMAMNPLCLAKGQNCSRAPMLCCTGLACDPAGLCN